jgi:hypothetical protein
MSNKNMSFCLKPIMSLCPTIKYVFMSKTTCVFVSNQITQQCTCCLGTFLSNSCCLRPIYGYSRIKNIAF